MASVWVLTRSVGLARSEIVAVHYDRASLEIDIDNIKATNPESEFKAVRKNVWMLRHSNEIVIWFRAYEHTVLHNGFFSYK